MADDRLRELERRAQQDGSVSSRAAVLNARQRLGQITDEGLEIASLLGDPAACAVLNRPVMQLNTATICSNRLRRYSREWQERAAAAALFACTEPRASHVLTHDAIALVTLQSRIEDWVECACDYHLDLLCAHRLSRDVVHLHPGAHEAARLVVCSCSASHSQHEHLKICLNYCSLLATWRRVLGTIRSELLPVALGTGDALRERSAPRLKAYKEQCLRDRARRREENQKRG